jgi:PII-like signaling protein
MQEITMVRVYLSEGRVQGVSVFRAIEGFGRDRRIKTSSLMDLSLELACGSRVF